MKSILRMIQKALTNNWMLKILALVIASIVWLAVININDPTKTVTIYNVPITLLNEDVITSNNQIYSVQGNRTVNVTVSGRRSVVSSLNVSSFTAEASMKELSLTNSVPVTVAVKNSNISGKVTITKQSVYQILFDIENIETKAYTIEENVTGQVSKNYELGKVTLVKNKVDITAPESVHSRIAKVAVNVDLDGVTADFTDKYRVILYDVDGNRITRDDTITLSNNKIQVSVSVLKLVKVPIVIETTGNLPSGYELANITTDVDEVVLAGPASAVDKITEMRISGESTDLTGLTGTVEREINLIDYLVGGVYIRGTSDVTLTIEVEGDITRKYTIKPSDITIENLSDEYVAEITSEEIEVTLSGKERDFEGVTKEKLKATINLKGLKEGKQNVDLELNIPEGLELSDSGKVKVKIETKQGET